MDYDHRHRRNWHHPRSMREAFGHELQPLRRSVTFRTCVVDGLCSAAIAVALLAVCVWVMLP